MSQELYEQMAVKLDAIKAAFEDAKAFAEEHKIIATFTDTFPVRMYIPDAALNEINPLGDRDYYHQSYMQLMEYYSEESDDADEAHSEYRGRWITSSSLCP